MNRAESSGFSPFSEDYTTYLASLKPGESPAHFAKAKTLKEKLVRFESLEGKGIEAGSFNRVCFARFIQFLILSCNLKESTISGYVRELRRFIRWQQPHKNLDFMVFKELHPNLVFLENKEIYKLERAKRLPLFMEKTNDIFLMALYSGVRYSDLGKLTIENIVKFDLPHSYQVKLINLLNKFGGKCPVVPRQELDDSLKGLFKYLKLNREITIHHRCEGRLRDFTFPLYDLTDIRVARNTCIMQLIRKRVPLNIVLKNSGISDFHSIRPYLAAHSNFRHNRKSR